MQGSLADPTKAIRNHQTVAHTADHGAAHHHDFRLFGVVVFLVAESMIFLGLFAAYGTFRLAAPGWTNDTELELLLPSINTAILVSSSFVINQANKAIKADNVRGLQMWFGITALMGAIFLAGQLYEYNHLEFTLATNLFASTFYVLTGFHGLHVCFGLVMILAVLWRSFKPGHYSSTSHFGVEAAELYWHFVDVVWIVLFLLLYIL
ncbi:MAG: heme-copper oxidase subunit III [Cyanobacteria bacterium]|nr:heme-copper oxidase subunit III [Cyanobacteriota bacterium]MDW8200444.1 heme-copper oxidase subunit III [Cyanobacteriota bacterium SKYGB_h_bin112]